MTLEPGGKAPTIVMDDADPDMAAQQALAIGFANNGQACIGETRILVPHDRVEAFCDAVRRAQAGIVQGDPRNPATTLGPLVNWRQYDRARHYISLALREGARTVIGGEGRPEGLERGWFIRPTVLAGVTNDMTIAREEVFGPVLCVIGYEDDEDAIRIASDTPYGLHAYLPGRDIVRARPSRAGSTRVVSRSAGCLTTHGALRRLQGIGHRPGIRRLGHRGSPRAEGGDWRAGGLIHEWRPCFRLRALGGGRAGHRRPRHRSRHGGR